MFSAVVAETFKVSYSDYYIQFREDDYISFIVNPLDFSFEVDMASLKVKNDDDIYEFDFSLEEFLDILNTNDEYVCFEKDGVCFEIKSRELKDYAVRLFKNMTSDSLVYTSKIVIIIGEGICVIGIVPFIYEVGERILKKIQKK